MWKMEEQCRLVGALEEWRKTWSSCVDISSWLVRKQPSSERDKEPAFTIDHIQRKMEQTRKTNWWHI